MSIFNFMETFFFISLGITFVLILLLVYHFKQRLSYIEKKGDTMFDIINNMVKEMGVIKTIALENANTLPPTHSVEQQSMDSSMFNHMLRNLVVPNNSNDLAKSECQEEESVEDGESDEDSLDDDENDNDTIESSESMDVSEEPKKINVSDNEDNIEDLEIDTISVDKLEEDEDYDDMPKLIPVDDLIQTDVQPDTQNPSIEPTPQPEFAADEVSEVDANDNVSLAPSDDIVIHGNNYRKLPVAELKALVHSKGIVAEGISKMKKNQLIKLLESHP